jgi:hypothetical protein
MQWPVQWSWRWERGPGTYKFPTTEVGGGGSSSESALCRCVAYAICRGRFFTDHEGWLEVAAGLQADVHQMVLARLIRDTGFEPYQGTEYLHLVSQRYRGEGGWEKWMGVLDRAQPRRSSPPDIYRLAELPYLAAVAEVFKRDVVLFTPACAAPIVVRYRFLSDQAPIALACHTSSCCSLLEKKEEEEEEQFEGDDSNEQDDDGNRPRDQDEESGPDLLLQGDNDREEDTLPNNNNNNNNNNNKKKKKKKKKKNNNNNNKRKKKKKKNNNTINSNSNSNSRRSITTTISSTTSTTSTTGTSKALNRCIQAALREAPTTHRQM